MIEVCRKCGKEADLPYKNKRVCRSCNAAYMREYHAKHKAEMNAKERKRYIRRRSDKDFVESERSRGVQYWSNLRHEAIMAYGGYKCACCGETEPLFLSIDHINNDGAEHRRSLGYEGNGKGASSATYSWLKKNGYPGGFQVLCMNCNTGKARNNGICPHKHYHKQTA